jgi:hypothetical protein
MYRIVRVKLRDTKESTMYLCDHVPAIIIAAAVIGIGALAAVMR